MSNEENLRGAAWMTLGMLGYVVNDAFVKKAVEDLALFQTIFIRGLMIVALISLIARVKGDHRRIGMLRDRHVGARVGIEAIGTCFFLLGLSNLPLADMTAVLQLVPLAVTFAAARLLREQVDWIRVATVLAGFVGVLFVVRPGSEGSSPWFLAAFAVVVLVTIRELVTKKISTEIPSLVIALGTGLVVTAMGGVVSIFEGWESIEGKHLIYLATASGFLSVGYTASVNAVRVGEMSFTAPFRYSILLFAIILQIVVFGDVPDAPSLIGSGIVGAAGLFSLTRERAVLATVRRG
ncbi:MAG: DMT family transporter [Actinomycetia bacterium]|nr:DMT family transporter [Actinomycetes bacterium]MCP4958971.1 DMT family transporter [Actinomycetes bacterium]